MRVLLADDDPDVLLALELLLRRERMGTARASSPAEVLGALARARSENEVPYHAVLLDLNYERDTTSGSEGFALLTRLRAEHPSVAVVAMTGWGSIEGAVEAMRRGAADYVPKPWDNARLVALLSGLAPGEQRALPELAPRGAESPAMQALHATVDQVAFSDLPILITGEHGTGKELVARSIHDKSGRRGAFVALNAGALAEGTFDSEVFGHVRGAFTDARSTHEGAFARAEHGTLFLDEITNMPLPQQAKLLRVLQERVYQPLGASAPRASTARVVSATNVDVDELARAGRFRADLLYRLNTVRLHVPPLRERQGELPGLVQRFVARELERYGLPAPALASDVLPALAAHAWPGNVRELEHVIQRAVLLSARTRQLTRAELDLGPAGTAPPSTRAAPAPLGTVHDAERAAILRALEHFPDDRRAAAASLGLSRSAFYRRLAQYGIRPPK
jgi:DNA-binding NtrC family response regulator